MDYKIEKGVKLDKLKDPRTKYPFGEMKEGDSFSFPNSERTKISSASTAYAKRTKKGMKFSIRKDGQENSRCFRLK